MQIPRARRAQSPSTKNAKQATRRAAAQAVERMESRQMMAVSLDAAGWTKITPSADTKTVYVSSSAGSDSNDGLSAASPVKTISKGVSLMRSGAPDWLVLKRGDVFKEAFPDWNKSGRNSQEPMVITSYGDPNADRPWLKTGSRRGFYSYTAFHDLAMIGLKFSANARDPNSPDYSTNAPAHGFQTVGPINGLLVEDTSFDHYNTNLSMQGFSGYAKNIKIRRSQFLDAYDMGVKAVGLYASMTEGLVLEGNLFDHNGWNEKIAGAPATIYSHNIYLWQSNRNAVVRDNIIANAGSHGLQARGGGTIENNLFVTNPIGALIGNGSEVTPGGVSGKIVGNVFIGSRDTAGMPRGWAIEAGNIKAGGGTVISDNIITQDQQNKFAAIKLETFGSANNASEGVGINDLTITRNILNKWYQAISINSGYKLGGSGQTGLNDLVVSDNDFQRTSAAKIVNHPQAYNLAEETWSNNRYYNTSSSSQWFSVGGVTTSFDTWKSKMEPTAQNQAMTYPDPDRNLAEYNATLGGAATEAAYMANVRLQSKDLWNTKYTAGAAISYIRAGFTGVTPNENPVTPPVQDPVTPPVVVPVTPPVVDPVTPPVLDPVTPPVVDPVTPPVVNPVTPPVVIVNQAPTAVLTSAPDRTVAGTGTQMIKVTYSDDKAVAVSSLGSGDLKVTAPNGAAVATTFLGADKSTDGTPISAIYAVAAPGGSWDSSDNGTYDIDLNAAYGVKDIDDVYAPAQDLGAFKVNIAGGEDTTPPQVLWSTFDPSAQTVTMRFSEDVSRSLNISDLRLKNLKTLALIPFDTMRMTYDKNTFTATWSFTQRLPAADYRAIIVSPGVTDAYGNRLDGNGDGVWTVNDDYAMTIRATDMLAWETISNSLVA